MNTTEGRPGEVEVISELVEVVGTSPRRQQVFRFESERDARIAGLVYLPGTPMPGRPVFVTVHGLSRNFEEHARLFAPFCESFGVTLVAPCFVEPQFKDYQRLGRMGRGMRADQALDTLLEEVLAATGIPAEPFHLFGFSGGAQFAHRYTMAHPERVAHAVIGASGWYTFPDRDERYPYGLRRGRSLRELRFEPKRLLRVPMTVMVGEHDVTNADLRRTRRVNRQQGLNRKERARNWVRAMRAAARVYRLKPRVELELLPCGDHAFATLMQNAALGERVFNRLYGAAVPARREEKNGA
jgi:pimeloyl-ACP methyl ester carboxylesterase